jgi:peptidoglycan/xylan/chitin deacetylase (PgdA/CDA1 family)
MNILLKKILTKPAQCVFRLKRRISRSRITILAYHGVSDSFFPFYNWCHTTPSQFQEQINLIRNQSTVLPLAEIASRIEAGKPLPSSTTSITFDDAFADLLQYAIPQLHSLQIPATVFVVSQLAQTGAPPWPEVLYGAIAHSNSKSLQYKNKTYALDSLVARRKAFEDLLPLLKALPTDAREQDDFPCILDALKYDGAVLSGLRTMKWEQIVAESSRGLVDFGAHSHTHPILTRCNPVRLEHEVHCSCSELREAIGTATTFAYPNGLRDDYNKEVIRLLQAEKVKAAVTMRPGINVRKTDPYQLMRVGVGRDISPLQFERRLAGL